MLFGLLDVLHDRPSALLALEHRLKALLAVRVRLLVKFGNGVELLAVAMRAAAIGHLQFGDDLAEHHLEVAGGCLHDLIRPDYIIDEAEK